MVVVETWLETAESTALPLNERTRRKYAVEPESPVTAPEAVATGIGRREPRAVADVGRQLGLDEACAREVDERAARRGIEMVGGGAGDAVPAPGDGGNAERGPGERARQPSGSGVRRAGDDI